MAQSQPTESGDLERRRLAIVRALRGEPASAPAPPTTTSGATADPRMVRLESDVAEVRRHLRELSARLQGQISSSGFAGGDTDDVIELPEMLQAAAAPPVPPVDPAGPMRDRAARALFGY